MSRCQPASTGRVPNCVHASPQGDPGPKHPEAAGRAIGAAVLAYWRNRASSPRDMTAEAAHQMRRACDEVLKETF